jgi:hypothetical protein
MAENKVELVISAKDTTNKAMRNVKASLAAVANTAKTTAIAIAGVSTALVAVAKSAASAGDQFQKMSLRLGISAQTLSEFAHVARISGSSIETVENGFRVLSARMLDVQQGLEESRRTFRNLGIEVENANGNLRAVEEVFMDSVEALNNLTSETEKTALAQELFGRAGTRLLPIVKSGKDGIQALREEAQTLGITFNQLEAEQSAAFEDALTRLKSSMTGLKNAIGLELIPAFAVLFDEITNKIKNVIPRVRDFAKQTAVVFLAIPRTVQDVFASLATNLEDFFINASQNLGEFAKGALTGFVELTKELALIFRNIAEVIFVPLVVSFKAVGRTIIDIWNAAMDVIKGNTEEFSIDIGSIFERNLRQAFVETGSAGEDAFNRLNKAGNNIAASFEGTFQRFRASVISISRDAFLEAEGDIDRFIERMKNAFEKEAPEAASNGMSQVNKVMEEWFGLTKETMLKFQDISKQAFQTFTQGVGDAFANAIVFGENLADALTNVLKRMVASVISTMIQMTLQQALQGIIAASITAKRVGGEMAGIAATTFGGVFAQVSQTPLWFTAPAVAASQTTAMLSGAAAAGATGKTLGTQLVVKGQADDGMASVPRRGTFLLDRGERVLSTNQNRDFTDFMQRSETSGRPVTVQNLNIMPGATVDNNIMKMSKAQMNRFVRRKVLPALNQLGKGGATTTLKRRRATT